MKKFLFALSFLAAAGAARAARVEADPTKLYLLTADVGPYLICVKGYTGPSAQALAHQLALHARRQGWPAYVFDYSAEERRKVQQILDERYRGAPPEVARRKTIRVEDQWGVFIGGYRDFESASKDVPHVKKTPWEELAKTTGTDRVVDSSGAIHSVSPYTNAFATRNPLVAPPPKANANGPDPLWKELNAGRPYNLLKCGKPWTLAIAQLHGVNVVQPRSASSDFLSKLGFGSKAGDTLAASALQAEEVARVLQKQNLEAYVLHTRGASVVTVGAFDSPDDPRLKQLQATLRKGSLGKDPALAQLIQFFPEPMPMQVPRY